MKLVFSALTKFLAGLFLVGALLFVPAGGFDFWNAWLLVAILFVPMLILGIVLCFKSPKLLEKRMNTNEKETTQKVVVAVSGVMFVFGFVVAALDHRFGWSNVPLWIVILSSVLFFCFVSSLCRGNARKCISFANSGGLSGSKGDRHGTLRYCSPSNVCGNCSDVFVNAIGAGFVVVVLLFFAVRFCC